MNTISVGGGFDVSLVYGTGGGDNVIGLEAMEVSGIMVVL